MLLTRLLLDNFRCYTKLDQCFSSPVNIINGDNGSGKTALIESIYWQSTGRSFRHHKSSDLIRHNQEQMVVYGEYTTFTHNNLRKLGIQYNRHKKKTIKLNNKLIQRQTDVAQQFPVISLDPNAFLWIDQSPGFRRAYLDWLVFHVEPQYLSIWKQTLKLHQHINYLLKNKTSENIQLWETKYAELAQQVHNLRLSVFNKIKPRFNELVKSFLPQYNQINIGYLKGWGEQDLIDQIINKRKRHFLQGYLGVGIHKADLTYTVDDKSAQIVLSRGQKKILAVIMYLLLIDIFEDVKQKSPVICIDDIDSELDEHSLYLLTSQLQKHQRQLFITTVDANNIVSLFSECDVFHVKQNKHQVSELQQTRSV